jgi:hypothetical protein
MLYQCANTSFLSFWSLESGLVSLQGPDVYDMEECKMSHFGVMKFSDGKLKQKGFFHRRLELKVQKATWSLPEATRVKHSKSYGVLTGNY